MNNPGSLVLTIADLSVIEALVQVDETDVSKIALGDSASIRIDAFPNREFVGRVTEIGNSAINPPSEQAAGQQAAIDFEVVITLDPTDAPLRPDLSATADIVVETRKHATSVPIIAMTVRQDSTKATADGDATREGEAPDDIEGVFLVHDERVTFVPVDIGIAGQEYFEVLSGLSPGDTVVAGPYQRIRQLRDGDQIRPDRGLERELGRESDAALGRDLARVPADLDGEAEELLLRPGRDPRRDVPHHRRDRRAGAGQLRAGGLHAAGVRGEYRDAAPLAEHQRQRFPGGVARALPAGRGSSSRTPTRSGRGSRFPRGSRWRIAEARTRSATTAGP